MFAVVLEGVLLYRSQVFTSSEAADTWHLEATTIRRMITLSRFIGSIKRCFRLAFIDDRMILHGNPQTKA